VESLEDRSLLSATSAISWTSAGLTHSALYAIGANDNVEVSIDGGKFTNLGGYAKQISGGLDASNEPEVYAIGADNAVWLDKGSGWVSLGGYAKQISATIENHVWVIGLDDAIYHSEGSPGLDWVKIGGYARQISAGADAVGNAELYVIGGDNAVYVGGGLGGFAKLGGYAKQIAATMDNIVYAIGGDNAVYKNTGSGSGWVNLGGYAKQISAGIDGTFGPFVLAIGLNDGLWSNHGSGWVSLGSKYVTEVSGPAVASFGVSLPADLAYAVGKGHGGLLHQGTSFTPLGGYIQTSSGSTTNDTNSWAPATRDTSAVSWLGPFGLTHHALYAIGAKDNVEVSFGGGKFTNLGGYAKQVSAGLDATSSPVVYAIGADNAVWLNNGSGWVSLGGYAKQISATVANAVYAIGTDDAVWVYEASGSHWVSLGGYAKQISAGTDAAGNPEVYAIGGDDAVYVNDGGPWLDRGGYVKQIVATMDNIVYAIGGDNAVYENSGSGWVNWGGYAKQISASIDGSGKPEVFAVGTDDALWVNHGGGFSRLGSNYVTEISAPAVDVGLSGDLAYVVAKAHKGLLHKGSFFSITGGKIE
jgi:hypothetical protein